MCGILLGEHSGIGSMSTTLNSPQNLPLGSLNK